MNLNWFILNEWTQKSICIQFNLFLLLFSAVSQTIQSHIAGLEASKLDN